MIMSNQSDKPTPTTRHWRLPRFGLRTLLTVIVAYCCLLCWIGARWRSLEEQKKVLATLERFSPGIVSSRGDVVVLSLKSTEIHDDDLRNVGQLKSLEVLDLEYTKITDTGIAHLAGLKNLRYLYISGTRITNDAMQTIGKLPKLEDLLIGATNVGDAGMAHLRDLTTLRCLDIGATSVGDEGLACLSNLQQLRRIYLGETHITDRGLEHLRNHQQLRFLALNGTRITDAGLTNLANLDQLETLWLHKTNISDAGLAHLDRMQGLQQLELMQTGVQHFGPDIRLEPRHVNERQSRGIDAVPFRGCDAFVAGAMPSLAPVSLRKAARLNRERGHATLREGIPPPFSLVTARSPCDSIGQENCRQWAKKGLPYSFGQKSAIV